MNHMEILQNMSEEELQDLMATDFGDLEKVAEAELASSELADALYTYGAFIADREVSECNGLSKVASEEYDLMHAEITGAIEQALLVSGLLESDDTVGLHKEAQAAAGIIFHGYTDHLEKIAEEGKGAGAWAKAVYNKAAEKLKEHKGKAGLVAGMGLGATAMHAAAKFRKKKDQEKTAAEIGYDELRAMMAEDAIIDATIVEGFAKLAEDASQKAEAAQGLWSKVKAAPGKAYDYAKNNKLKVGLGVGGTAAAIYGAKKLMDKRKQKQQQEQQEG